MQYEIRAQDQFFYLVAKNDEGEVERAEWLTRENLKESIQCGSVRFRDLSRIQINTLNRALAGENIQLLIR